MELKSIAENETPTTIDMAKYIRSRIEENYHSVLQQIEDGTWDRLSVGHLKALRDRCNQELWKRGVRDARIIRMD